MPSLLNTLDELFGTRDLYEALGVDRQASENDIKRGYRKRSLQIHPDRVPAKERPVATRKFQALGAVYAILSDHDKRGLYDESGEVDEESDAGMSDRNWQEYWRLLFKKITPEDVKNFEKEYRHSEEELADLKQAYLDGEGNMKFILDNVLCCTDEDEERFSNIITGWIEAGDVPHFKSFKKLSTKEIKSRKRKAAKEAKEAEELAQELGMKSTNGSEDALTSMIMRRQENRAKEADNFLNGLLSKYGGESNKKATKKGRKK